MNKTAYSCVPHWSIFNVRFSLYSCKSTLSCLRTTSECLEEAATIKAFDLTTFVTALRAAYMLAFLVPLPFRVADMRQPQSFNNPDEGDSTKGPLLRIWPGRQDAH